VFGANEFGSGRGMSVGGLARSRTGRHELPRTGLLLSLALAALLGLTSIGGLLAASRPSALLALLLGAPLAFWLVTRLRAAVGLLVASFFFDGYLAATGLLSPAKLIGVVACVSLVHHVLVRQQALLVPPLLLTVAAFGLWVIVARAFAHDGVYGNEVALRYIMLFVLAFLVVQSVAGDRSTVDVFGDVLTAAAGIAAVLGLYEFLLNGAERATGPVEDPNDFAFLLCTVVPVTVYRIRWGGGRVAGALRVLALVVMFGCIMATFSRGGLVALGAAAAWALWTRRLAVRWAVLSLVAMVAVAGLALYTNPETVTSAFERKENVAQSNIDTRFITWELAVEQFLSSPIVGVGPGNFEYRYWEFALPYDLGGAPPPPHNAYLHILAEFGAPGFALFALYLLLGWGLLRRRSSDPRTDALLSSLAAGFLVALVGAVFLSEQYYAPMWVFPALGATLLVRDRGAPTSQALGDGSEAGPAVAVAGGEGPAKVTGAASDAPYRWDRRS